MLKMKLLSAFAAVALLAACGDSSDSANTGGAGGAGAGVARPGSQEDLAQNVGDRVFFDTARNTLRTDARATLDRQAAWLQQYPQNNVQLQGNADERGTREYNIALGQRRANAAREYLAARGVAASRMNTISFGKDRPTALGSDESSWSQNRNATTVLR